MTLAAAPENVDEQVNDQPDEGVDTDADETQETDADDDGDDSGDDGQADRTSDDSTADDGDAGGGEESFGLSEEELAAARANPATAKVLKSMQRGFTQKTQALGELSKAEPLLRALKENPDAAIAYIAAQRGYKLHKDAADAPDVVAEVKSMLEGALEPELAGKLLPAFEKLAKHVAATQTESLRVGIERVQAEAATRESAEILRGFAKDFPDYPKFEKKMIELSIKFPPSRHVSEREYIESLYHLASRGANKAKEVRELADKMHASAKASSKPGASAHGKVSSAPPKARSLKEAVNRGVRAAIRGERFTTRD